MDFTTSSTSATSAANARINVNGSSDSCYRYKMEPLRTTITNAKGGTTIVENAKQVAHDIYRELPDLKSWFAKSLSTRVSVDNGRIIISGRYTEQQLQKSLQIYISKNVLCHKCGNPETPTVKKRTRKCQACGYSWS